MANMRQRVSELLGKDIRETTETRGGDHRSPEFHKRATFLVGAPDTADKIVARLKRDAQSDPVVAALAQQVISGDVTPNAAARRMGWRNPRIVLSSPERVAQALRSHYPDPGHRQMLADLLTAPEAQDGPDPAGQE